MNEFTWTEERIKRLKDLLPNYRYEVCASMMGTSRNSVAGAVYRYFDKDDSRRKNSVKKKEIKTEIRQHGPLSINFPRKEGEYMPRDVQIFHKPVPWPPGAGKCHAVIGQPSKMRACGLKAIDSRPWCAMHAEVYFRKIEKQ